MCLCLGMHVCVYFVYFVHLHLHMYMYIYVRVCVCILATECGKRYLVPWWSNGCPMVFLSRFQHGALLCNLKIELSSELSLELDLVCLCTCWHVFQLLLECTSRTPTCTRHGMKSRTTWKDPNPWQPAWKWTRAIWVTGGHRGTLFNLVLDLVLGAIFVPTGSEFQLARRKYKNDGFDPQTHAISNQNMSSKQSWTPTVGHAYLVLREFLPRFGTYVFLTLGANGGKSNRSLGIRK